jgi:hypothetical protein
MAAPSPIPIKNARMFPLPEWYLPKGTINASDNDLEGASSSCERWGLGFAGVVVFAVVAELVIAWLEPPYLSFLTYSAIADAVIALGIAGEVLLGTIWNNRIQTELRSRSNKQLASAIQSAAEANERASKADLARTQLEAQLSPRMLNQRQWDLIQSFRGQFPAINIGYETDAECWWFAMTAGINSVLIPRDPTVHTFSIIIFDPSGFDGSRPKTVAPLVELFKAEDQLSHGTAAIIGGLPTDILRQVSDNEGWKAIVVQTPMIIVGGRFMVPPSHWPKPAKPGPPPAAQTNNANP